MSEAMMDKEQRKPTECGTALQDVCGEVIVCEAAGDFVLADYQGQICKILDVRTAVLPAGKYLGGGRAEFAGTVQHTVLYTDAEGKLASVTLPADYSFTYPLPEGGEYTAAVSTVAVGTVHRLGGPRKISLRTRLQNTLHLYRHTQITPEIRGMGSEADAASLEVLKESAESMRMLCGTSGEFPLSATAKTDSPAVGSAVWAGGHVLIQECRPQAGGCLCRGEVWARCLMAAEEGTPYAVRERIPFEEFVPIEGASEASSCTAVGRLLSASVTAVAGEEGEGGTVEFDLSAELEACAVEKQPCNPVRDLYSTACAMTCHYKKLSLTRPLGACMAHYTVSGSRPRTECEAENATAILDASGRAEVQEVTAERGRATVCGRVTATVIFSSVSEGGEERLSSCEIECPFRVETELRTEPGEKPHFECLSEVVGVRARIEQSAMAAECELALCLRATEQKCIEILESAEPDHSEEVEHRGNRIRVVYPKEGQTLFSLAARYHRSRAAIAAENGLSEDAVAISHLPHSLDGMHHLLITDEA